jgi:hypothetical protein
MARLVEGASGQEAARQHIRDLQVDETRMDRGTYNNLRAACTV